MSKERRGRGHECAALEGSEHRSELDGTVTARPVLGEPVMTEEREHAGPCTSLFLY